MKYGYYSLGMLLVGCIGLVVIVMFGTVTLNNESEYYVLNEAMEAAMLESVDIACYRLTDQAVDTIEGIAADANGCNGQIKISEQKFVENFTRRFTASISGDVNYYTIKFYDIVEMPPKVSVLIESSNKEFKLVSDSIDIENGLSGILEFDVSNYSSGSEELNNESVYVPGVPSFSGDGSTGIVVGENDTSAVIDEGESDSAESQSSEEDSDVDDTEEIIVTE